MYNLDVPGYTVVRVIGIGSFATVYLAHRNSNGELVAIKVIDRSRLNKKLAGNLIGEIAVLREFRHPNIVSFHELQVSPKYAQYHSKVPIKSSLSWSTVEVVIYLRTSERTISESYLKVRSIESCRT
jgi:serine/threonine protein kinase